MSSAQGLACTLSWAKSMRASRSFLLQPRRNVTCQCLPEARVDGATPAAAASDASSGNRSRQSPISARSSAARFVPALGNEVKITPSGVQLEGLSDPLVEHLDAGADACEE